MTRGGPAAATGVAMAATPGAGSGTEKRPQKPSAAGLSGGAEPDAGESDAGAGQAHRLAGAGPPADSSSRPAAPAPPPPGTAAMSEVAASEMSTAAPPG